MVLNKIWMEIRERAKLVPILPFLFKLHKDHNVHSVCFVNQFRGQKKLKKGLYLKCLIVILYITNGERSERLFCDANRICH